MSDQTPTEGKKMRTARWLAAGALAVGTLVVALGGVASAHTGSVDGKADCEGWSVTVTLDHNTTQDRTVDVVSTIPGHPGFTGHHYDTSYGEIWSASGPETDVSGTVTLTISAGTEQEFTDSATIYPAEGCEQPTPVPAPGLTKVQACDEDTILTVKNVGEANVTFAGGTPFNDGNVFALTPGQSLDANGGKEAGSSSLQWLGVPSDDTQTASSGVVSIEWTAAEVCPVVPPEVPPAVAPPAPAAVPAAAVVPAAAPVTLPAELAYTGSKDPAGTADSNAAFAAGLIALGLTGLWFGRKHKRTAAVQGDNV